MTGSIPLRSLLSTPRAAARSTSARIEQFSHITGEVTNPVLLENLIMEHPMVHSAIMFGHGRYSAGILIQLEDRYKIDANDTTQVEAVRNKLQPALDRMNTFAPPHARVQKEMVLFAASTKPFIHAPLSSARVNGRDTLAKYNGEINALYETVARAAQVALKPPKIWSPKNSLAYIRDITVAVLGRKLDDDADFFARGMDSLQATHVRIILFHALRRTTKMDTRKLSGDIIRQHPTIASLAIFATYTTLAHFRQRTESSVARCREMATLVECHSLEFPIHQPSVRQPRDDVVLITGTMDLLGSNLLAQLLQRQDVARVYALNRKEIRLGSLLERQASSLEESGLDPTLARHPKLILVESDASRTHFDVSARLYNQLLCSVTHIVHNAWPSTTLSAFDGSFRTLRNLINFALSSRLPAPPRFVFISTTDTLRGASANAPQAGCESKKVSPPRGLVEACAATGSTHGESKWVGEQILASAASETPLQPIIVRVGPLCGASNGRWGEDALLPMIAHLGVALGALPKIDEVVRWLPVHTAAQAVVDARHAASLYVHIAHPSPVSALALLRSIGEALQLPLVPLSRWAARLADRVHAAPHPCAFAERDDPALVLLRRLHLAHELARDRDCECDAPPGARVFDHVQIPPDEVTCFASASPPALSIADIQLWLQHWEAAGIVPG